MAAHAASGDDPDAETVQAVLERVDGKGLAVVCDAGAAPAPKTARRPAST